jgi:hypothetical protein
MLFGNNCDPNLIVEKACQYFKNESNLFISHSDKKSKFMNPVQLIKKIEKEGEKAFNSLDKFGNPSMVNQERVQKIFSETKNNLIEFVKNGVTDERFLSPAKISIINRINLIKLAVPEDMTRDLRIECAISLDGAFFNSLNLNISICPKLYDYPENLIKFSIGHELAHAFDSCMSQHPVFELNQATIDSLDENHHAYGGWAQYFNGEDEKINFVYQGEVKEKIDLLGNLFSKDKPLANPILRKDHPYLNVVSCIKDNKNVKFSVNQSDSCQHSSENEALGDVFGAWAVNTNLSEKLSLEDQRGIISSIDPRICEPRNKQKPSSHGHPAALERVTGILLQMPGMLKKFGCDSPKENKCFKDFYNPKTTTVTPVNLIEDANQR